MLAPRLLGGVVRVSSVGARRSAPAAFRAAARTGRSFSSPAAATAAKEPPAAATPAAAGTAAAAAKADIREGASGNMLMLGFAGGVVIAAGNLASVVFDNPPACKLAIQIANKNETLKAAVGSRVEPTWWGFDWEGQVLENRAAVSIPLSLGSDAKCGECLLRGKAVIMNVRGADGPSPIGGPVMPGGLQWQFIVLEAVMDGGKVINLMKGHEVDNAEDGLGLGSSGNGHGHGGAGPFGAHATQGIPGAVQV